MTALIPLVAVWLIVLVPQGARWLSRRREMVESFQSSLEALARGEHSAEAVVPRASAAQRRRTVFTVLLLSMGVSLASAIVLPRKSSLAVHLVIDDLFLLYVGLLVHWRDYRTRPVRVPASSDVLLTPDMVQPVLR
jgi:hypothetical protein